MRAFALTALVALLVATGYVLLRGDDSYVVHTRFPSAGGLVTGGDVRVGGRKVGSIAGIELTDDAQADVQLSIDRAKAGPLTHQTRATIRAVGQAGVTNRYVDLAPGHDDGPELTDGATLPATQTFGYVNLDAILSSMDRPARQSIQHFLRRTSDVYAGSGARSFNAMLGKLSPGLRELSGLMGDLGSDDAELERLIERSAEAATAIASRRPDLRAAVDSTAVALRALADEREALGDGIARAPAVLRQGQGTLARAATAVTALRPVLRDVPAAARPLAADLRALPPSLGRFTPTLRRLNQQLPGVARVLEGLAPLRRPAVEALDATATALRESMPILAGLRYYGPDFILGIFNGLVGISTAPYDASGHYAHLEFTQSPQQLLGGSAASLLTGRPLLPGLFDLRSRLDARCPGSTAPPAPDGSSPWIPDSSICDPAQNTPAAVNSP